ncbi:MAG: VTT domain-containing protein [Planctomycetes bacterium]|nr:VTT domain-containing protein [Planctomycetota bacterium]
MRELVRPAMLICLIMAVPILPFVVFGDQWVKDWSEQENSAPITATLVIALLSSDIFLPVPSSMISTFAGTKLGTYGGPLVSWIGMNLGALIGFALARRFGPRFARWLSKDKDLDRMKSISDRYGPVALIMTRGVPVLAEASVLLMGIHRLSWRRFLLPVLVSNLVLSVAYAGFGAFAQKNEWLGLALGVSIAVPVLLATIMGKWTKRIANETRANDQDE